jgi:hypothetical protein
LIRDVSESWELAYLSRSELIGEVLQIHDEISIRQVVRESANSPINFEGENGRWRIRIKRESVPLIGVAWTLTMQTLAAIVS